ncbi:ABC transporter ATP-binding protein [Thalassotalea sp. ND16A]|uniref:ABC transporter ATP-binding protein n=1 Tax=Thalassotalea sp. ND16A TaxID=1535422 RepID=UPI00051A074C|nr:ABC transporter ATP-binding protein [Thalassotalea sp. ND16A]KGJ88713.1 Fe(3+)-transporting ATPase [Thalassotalea sp. ND16A]
MSCLIKAQQLNKFFGSNHALCDVDFEIERGGPVALVGPNGAGKTTLFSILCGYLKPSSGSVTVFGEQPASHKNLSRLSALPQDAQLDPRFAIAQQLSFYAQLQGFSKREAHIEAERTLELVGLSEVLTEKPGSLSHGMRKRVTIAQALIGAPEIVMLDEATAGLDPKHAREVRELVATLSSDITFILSSHDLSELERLCDQVLYLDLGHLQQHQSLNAEDNLSFFTLRMEQQQPDLIAALSSLKWVTSVVNSQDKEYQISVQTLSAEQPIDIEILKLCYQNKWRYRQLINGRTLENQLFSD